LLLSDSIYIGSNITFDNLAPLSTYLGKPGDPAKGGLSLAEYQRRQAQHEQAETAALLDTAHFVDRAKRIYGYPNFVCDSGGSICEVVDPRDPNDPVLTALSETVLMVWLEGSEDHTDELIHRFDKDPKPMCYQPAFLAKTWGDYLSETGARSHEVDPDAFIRWAFARALAHRAPRYRDMAERWGITVQADDAANVGSSLEFIELIGATLDAKS
ncbi:MAG: ATPase, partial [Pseudomonadota bacterium]